LLADRQVTALNPFWNGIEPVSKVEVNEAGLPVLHLIQRGRLLRLSRDIGKSVITKDLNHPEFVAFLLIPVVIEPEGAWIFRAKGFGFVSCLRLFLLYGPVRRRLCIRSILFRAGYSKILKLNLDPKSYWLFTTRPKDRLVRDRLIADLGYDRAFEALESNAYTEGQHAIS
jgi:hypothetical protein